MFWKLFLLFTLVPLLELILLIHLGQWIGILPTILLVFITGVIGATMAKIQGLLVIRNFQLTLKKGQVPAMGMMEGLLIIIAAALLVTPGLLTDLVGFALLIPTSRELVALYGIKYISSLVKGKVGYRGRKEPYTIDIDWEEDD